MPVPIPPYAADPSQLIVGSPIDPATYLTPYTGPPPPKPPIAPPPASTVAALQGRAGGPFLPGAIPGVPGVPVRTDVGGAAAGQGRDAQQPPAGAAASPYGYDPGPQLRAAEQERAAQEKRAADLRTNAQRLIGEIPPAWNLDNPLETQAQLKRAQAALDESQSAYAAALKHMPQKPEVDSIAHFGGLATIVGLLAGAFSRRPLTASLNAAGAAMESYNQGDLRNYKMSVDQWKMQTDYLLSIAKMNESALSSIIARTDLSERQRLDRLKILSQVLGMGDVANEAQVKGLSAYADRIGDIAKVRAELAKAQATQEEANSYREATLGLRSQQPGLAVEKDTQAEIASRDQAWAVFNPTATDQQKQAQHFKNVRDVRAEMTDATRPVRSIGVTFAREYQKSHPGATFEDAYRAYRRDGSIESAFGTGQAANNLRSLNTLAEHLSLLREYAIALQSGSIPRANALLQRFAVETGHPEVTNFKAMRDIAADETVRLLTSTGGTEQDRKDMQANFAQAASPEQIGGAIEVAGRSVTGRLAALEQQYARNDPQLRTEFENNMLTPLAREWFQGVRPATLGPGPVVGENVGAAPPTNYRSADQVRSDYHAGKLTRDQAEKVLRDHPEWGIQ